MRTWPSLLRVRADERAAVRQRVCCSPSRCSPRSVCCSPRCANSNRARRMRSRRRCAPPPSKACAPAAGRCSPRCRWRCACSFSFRASADRCGARRPIRSRAPGLSDRMAPGSVQELLIDDSPGVSRRLPWHRAAAARICIGAVRCCRFSTARTWSRPDYRSARGGRAICAPAAARSAITSRSSRPTSAGCSRSTCR